jgi:hypothetical protein
VGDLFRLTRDQSWIIDGQEIVIPEGERGIIIASKPGCDVKFEHTKNPKHPLGCFAMSLHFPGHTRYDDSMTLLKRKMEVRKV